MMVKNVQGAAVFDRLHNFVKVIRSHTREIEIWLSNRSVVTVINLLIRHLNMLFGFQLELLNIVNLLWQSKVG